jgi:YVTN family beta-propeller protein
MDLSRPLRRRGAVPAALSLAAVLGVLLPGAAPAAAPSGLRDVLVVSNNWAGTADIIDVKTSKRLKRLDVVPDKAERIAEITADTQRTFFFDGIRALVGDGHDQFVDDGFASKDGRLIYFSRPSFADVVAIDVKTNRIRWRVPVEGYRADHMGLSPDGRRLLVSASTASKVHMIDTARGRIVGSFASGYAPHENNFSRDGRTIFHANLGTPYTDTDDFSQDEGKGARYFELVDARTLRVRTRIEMGKELARYGLNVNGAVRPMAIAPDERTMFFQLSFVHGFVEWDLVAMRPKRVMVLPFSDVSRRMPRQQYTQDSAHHGLTFDNAGRKLCVAGTMSNYAAIVRRSTLTIQATVPVGDKPYWSTTSRDGRYCYVSVSGNDRVSVIDYRTAREVRRIPVGDHPQRMRIGYVRADAVD